MHVLNIRVATIFHRNFTHYQKVPFICFSFFPSCFFFIDWTLSFDGKKFHIFEWFLLNKTPNWYWSCIILWQFPEYFFAQPTLMTKLFVMGVLKFKFETAFLHSISAALKVFLVAVIWQDFIWQILPSK